MAESASDQQKLIKALPAQQPARQVVETDPRPMVYCAWGRSTIGRAEGVLDVPRIIDASFEVVTPAYVGGAQDGARQPAEVRIPSLLGVLRFWWRALEWGRILAEAAPAASGPWHERYHAPVARLREREGRLFGAAGQGQGLVLASLERVTVDRCDLREGITRNQRHSRPEGGAAYLAGQGLRDRGAVGAGSTFTLHLIVRPRMRGKTASADDLASVIRAVRCLGLLGGVGARSRRGFGSLTLRQITDSDGVFGWRQPADLKAYGAELRDLNDGTWSSAEPPLTAFSAGSRLTLVPAVADQDPMAVLADQGLLFQRYRSKGVQNQNDINGPHRIGGFPVDLVDHRFRDDFAWFDGLLDNSGTTRGPRRAMFGLPHNYFSRSRGGRKATVAARIPDEATSTAKSDRRASPLFLHIHSLGNRGLVAAWLFLPALFLPDVPKKKGPQLLVNDRAVDYTPCWSPILDFYTRLGTLPGHKSVWS